MQQRSVRAPAHDAALSIAHNRGSSSLSPVTNDSKQAVLVPATAAQCAPRNSSSNSLSVSADDDWRAFAQAALHSNSDVESACTVLTTCEHHQQQQQHSTSRQQHTLLTAVDLLVSTTTT